MVLFSFLQNFINEVPPELAILIEIGVMIIIATLLAFLVKISKQPLIPAYIFTGIIIGPLVLGLIDDTLLITSLSQIGVAFLIFTAGIEIKFRKLKEVGMGSSIAGIIQIIILFFLAFLVSSWLGYTGKAPVYIGLIVAFSSTMIVVALLAEKNELNSLHGRIIISILLIQDIAAIIALSVLSSNFSLSSIGIVLGKALLFGFFAFVLSKASNKFLGKTADNKELLLLASISFLFLFIIASFMADLSLVIGAFFAGVALANSDYKTEIQSNINPLREFFAVIFFVALGMQLKLISSSLLLLLSILFFLVMIIKPLVIMYLVRFFGYQKRTAFLTGNALGQTSEFSFVIVMLGASLGHINSELFSALILLTILTMSFTTYFISHERKLSEWFSWPLNVLDGIKSRKEELEYLDNHNKVILFGCHRMGSLILREFEKNKDDILVVDYDPEIIKALINKKIPCIYGDFMHEEILDKVNIKQAEVIISTVPDFEDNLHLIGKINRLNINKSEKKTIVIVVASKIHEALELYKRGADYVILPKFIGGEVASSIVKKASKDKQWLRRIRNSHKKRLESVHRVLY
ncbi:MAG: cation:proton antiporter [Nanoarchaeota archaeon]